MLVKKVSLHIHGVGSMNEIMNVMSYFQKSMSQPRKVNKYFKMTLLDSLSRVDINCQDENLLEAQNFPHMSA